MLRAALAIALVAVAAPPTTEVTPVSQPLTVISLTFDDGYRGQFPAALAMDQFELAGTFYVNSGAFEWSGYMDLAQIRELARAGHEIGGHTADHVRLTSLPGDRARNVVCSDRQHLLDAGFDVRTFAYPFGAYDDGVVDAVMDCGYDGARTASGLFTSPDDCGDCPTTESWPELDHRFNIRTPSTVRRTDSVFDMQQVVLRAERSGGWLPIVFHRICDGCADESTALEDFRAFARWLEARPSTTIVAPVAEALDLAQTRSRSRSATVDEVPPVPSGGTALVQRPWVWHWGDEQSSTAPGVGPSAAIVALLVGWLIWPLLYPLIAKRRR